LQQAWKTPFRAGKRFVFGFQEVPAKTEELEEWRSDPIPKVAGVIPIIRMTSV